MPYLTIVMPAYNASSYINKSLESIIAQTFTDWELIIVDDASVDNTRDIVKSYMENDSRIKYYMRKNNSGYAHLPRLEAIEYANTDWICCIDSDDFVEESFLEKQVNRQRETGADAVLCNMLGYRDEKVVFSIPDKQFDTERILQGREACELTIGKWQIGFNGSLVRKPLYDNLYDGCSDLGSDEYDSRIIFCRAKQVAISNAYYYYVQHSTSVVHKVSPFYFTKTNQDIRTLDFLISEFPNNRTLAQKQWDFCLGSIYGCLLQYYINNKYWSNKKTEVYRLLRHNHSKIVKYCKTGQVAIKRPIFISSSFLFLKSQAYTRYVLGSVYRYVFRRKK